MPQSIFEIMGRRGALAADLLKLKDHYERGLAAYRARKWDDAESAFNSALEAMPGDGPANTMLGRIATLKSNPPLENWDGVWRADHK